MDRAIAVARREEREETAQLYQQREQTLMEQIRALGGEPLVQPIQPFSR
jgi:hypothetical protein